jgi:putative nucleotidyltransferase with HDIG domain
MGATLPQQAKDLNGKMISSPEEFIQGMTDLPSLPAVISEVLQLTVQTESSAESLASTIEADHALTMTLLRIANSAFYGLAQEVYTVRDAIIVIGFEAVRSIAISALVVTGMWVEDDVFDARRFWVHSLSCGMFAQSVAAHVRRVTPDVAFTLGVLHDIGQIIFVQTIPKSYRPLLQALKSQRCYLWQAERALLGYHHGEIGAAIARKWNLPVAYCDAIRLHHESDISPTTSLLARLLTLSDALSHYTDPSERERRTVQPLHKSLWEPLGLDESAIRAIILQAKEIGTRTQFFYEAALRKDGSSHVSSPRR